MAKFSGLFLLCGLALIYTSAAARPVTGSSNFTGSGSITGAPAGDVQQTSRALLGKLSLQ